MADAELARLTLADVGALLRRRAVSPVELAGAVLARIAATNPLLNAFTTLVPDDQVLAAARTAEDEIARGGWRGPLHGVPVGVKDLIDTAGLRTTYGSGMFQDHVPTRDGAMPERLRAAGAILLGKTATHELGKGITTNNAFFGATRNPWRLDHVPGGSSGGAAAAVAAGMGPLHVGTDGGGSIRLPAAFCGVTGLKPTLGLLSNRGQFGRGDSSFSTPGPLVRSVRDAAIAAQALAGFDPDYVYSRPGPVPDLLSGLDAGVRGLRVAVSPDLLEPAPDAGVRAAYEASLRRLEQLGARLVEVRMPSHRLVLRGVITLFAVEAATAIDRLIGDRPRVFSAALERINALTPAPDMAAWVQAQQDRQRVRRDYEQAFLQADVLVMPVAPVPAPRLTDDELGFTPRCTAYTGAANLVGFPAVPLPAGLVDGLPVAIQILAPPGGDAVALRVAFALEQTAPEHRVREPPLRAGARNAAA
jgi:Asp-tRNA(Asn)/Glu-tRNA(Gln) amidotransferase A subunit family amidase